MRLPTISDQHFDRMLRIAWLSLITYVAWNADFSIPDHFTLEVAHSGEVTVKSDGGLKVDVSHGGDISVYHY